MRNLLAGAVAGLRARVRRTGGHLIRRAHLLPADQPDGLGEDDRLLGKTLPHEVMVFFADRPAEAYQLESWLAPLEALDAHRRTVIVLQDSRTAKLIRARTGLDVLVIARNRTMDDLLSRSGVRAALYLNYHPRNYFNLRFTSLVHVHLTHGDSDKRVTVSHQINAYDVALVAGRAAIDRLAAHATFFDAEARCIPIGRPQLDSHPHRIVGHRQRPSGDPPMVLYAPTWAGALPSVAYGSVDSHGEHIVAAALAAGARVLYRPHPLAKSTEADQRIRRRLAADPRHRIHGRDTPLQESFDAADLLVTDVSAVAVDWLATDRPLLITKPVAPEAVIAVSRLTETIPLVPAPETADTDTATATDRLAALIRTHLDDDPLAEQRRELIGYYLTDVNPGAATQNFLAGVDEAIARHEREVRRDETHL